MNQHGIGAIERDLRERNIVVDNSFRPGKGSKPRPIASMDDLGTKLESIFKWKRRKQRAYRAKLKLAKHPFPGIIP